MTKAWLQDNGLFTLYALIVFSLLVGAMLEYHCHGINVVDTAFFTRHWWFSPDNLLHIT